MLPQRKSRPHQNVASSSFWHPAQREFKPNGKETFQDLFGRKLFRVRGKHKGFCNIAILGFGTVGSAVARILSERAPDHLSLTHVCNRDVTRKKVDWVPADVQWTDEFNYVLNSKADVIVELIGGLKPAEDCIRRALLAGKSVVTANKQVIAHCGPELLKLARERNCQLAFGAAVAGGVPVISGLQDGLAGDEISEISGILNGTCNYILSEIDNSGVPFSTALSEAQRRGYAEADPSDDIDGIDARAKLVILARVALHANVPTQSISCRSIASVEVVDFEFAKQLGFTIRQVSRAQLKGEHLFASVQPMLVSLMSPLASTQGSQNTVVCTGKFGGETIFRGQGAGGNPTAVAVVSDTIMIARSEKSYLSSFWPTREISPRVTADFQTRHYLRFRVRDGAGIIPSLTTMFEKSGLHIESLIEEPCNSKRNLRFAIILKPSSISAVEKTWRQVCRLNSLQACLNLPILN